ncbi:MAG: hypothetical protein FJ004_11795 [Chloroflexi bacterium]|nr:hypothetical protein [Chloroflexota bacterium]
MAYWLVIGPSRNWAFSFKNGNIWGFSPRYQKTWESLAQGDTIVCYVTRPVKGLVGYCQVRSRYEEDSEFFPQEVRLKQTLWPLRIILVPQKIISREVWHVDCVKLKELNITYQRALQRLPDRIAQRMINELDKRN